MTNEELSHSAGRARAIAFRRGDVVWVVFGPLTGVIGVFEGPTADGRCTVSVTGVSEGVLILLEPSWLEPADPLSFGGAID